MADPGPGSPQMRAIDASGRNPFAKDAEGYDLQGLAEAPFLRPSTLRALKVIDLLLLPFLYPAAWLLKIVRRRGLEKLPACRKALLQVGVMPIRDHFYEPRFDYRNEPADEAAKERDLPGIDWNPKGQLAWLDSLVYGSELLDLPEHKGKGADKSAFHFNNGFFEAGDAECWYQAIRALKPKRIFEIGSGYSTLLATAAIEKNRSQDADYRCRHLCIEPYRQPWLEALPVEVLRERVEVLGPELFTELERDDLLFIDSSHVIRPGGDVLFEYLHLLPSLKEGVVVHIHDIFTPMDYPANWLQQNVRFWNEQYLLEALLSNNPHWQVLGGLHYLYRHHRQKLQQAAPHLTDANEPSSIYLRKVSAEDRATAKPKKQKATGGKQS